MKRSETGEPPELKAARVTPEMAGLPRATLDQFTGGDVATNTALLYDVLTGIPGARRDIVLLNAAAALVAAGLAGDLKEGVPMGAEAIDRARPRRRWQSCGSSGRGMRSKTSAPHRFMRPIPGCLDRAGASLTG